MRRVDSLEKTLRLGGSGGQEEMGTTEDETLDGISNSMDMSLSKLWELLMEGIPGLLQSTGSQRVGHD